jgi:hypothetical protein
VIVDIVQKKSSSSVAIDLTYSTNQLLDYIYHQFGEELFPFRDSGLSGVFDWIYGTLFRHRRNITFHPNNNQHELILAVPLASPVFPFGGAVDRQAFHSHRYKK